MIDPFSRIKALDRQGNFNGVIFTAVGNYRDLSHVKPELLERIAYYLRGFRPLICPRAMDALRSLPVSDLEHAALTEILQEDPPGLPAPAVGRIAFPAVTSVGFVREICLTEDRSRVMGPSRVQLLDLAGAALFRVMKERLGRHFIWRPERFSFHVLDPFEKDDPAVEGDSMSLPLALALYSRVTATPLPRDLSATAALGRDGTLSPVESLEEKLAILHQERFFIKRVMVSASQKIQDQPPGLEVIKVRSLAHAVSIAFPDRPDVACFGGDLDLEAEIRSINDQFDRYLLDTCIENADELIRHLESSPSTEPREKAVPALFTCYWKKGSSHCHKGEIGETNRSLKKAMSLYSRHPGLIRGDHYFEAQISYAVLLKDIFRYKDAEALHLRLIDEMKASRVLDHVKGKNLSTLSQLYLATGRFEEAGKYQKQALKLINREEICRNYGYLAQIHARSGAFRKAAAALAQYSHRLEASDVRVRGAHTPFYRWIRAEYLYRRGMAMKKNRRPVFRELYGIADKYPEPGWWVPALIHKFSGLAILAEGLEAEGLEEMETAIRFFSAQFAPVLRLLGASARTERALHFFRSERREQALEDIKGIIEDLSLQKDIRRFFRPELLVLGRFLGSRSHRKNGINATFKALGNISTKIPY